MAKLIEGQTLWWVPRQTKHSQAKEVTVTKVGRKWAQLDNHHRIDIETLIADSGGYSPPGACYVNREGYEEELAISKAWACLKQDMQYINIPAGVSAADIASARQLLGLPNTSN